MPAAVPLLVVLLLAASPVVPMGSAAPSTGQWPQAVAAPGGGSLDGACRRSRAVAHLRQHTTTVYDAVGNVLAATDGDGRTTRVAVDALNRRVLTTLPHGATTATLYDAVGQREKLRTVISWQRLNRSALNASTPSETQDSHLLAEKDKTQDSHLLAETQSLVPQRQHPR